MRSPKIHLNNGVMVGSNINGENSSINEFSPKITIGKKNSALFSIADSDNSIRMK